MAAGVGGSTNNSGTALLRVGLGVHHGAAQVLANGLQRAFCAMWWQQCGEDRRLVLVAFTLCRIIISPGFMRLYTRLFGVPAQCAGPGAGPQHLHCRCF